MPMPRQFTMMMAGDLMSLQQTNGQWDTYDQSGPAGFAYYNTQRLDLRGLLAGDEQGVGFSNIVLQEGGPLRFSNQNGKSNLMCVDMLTTQRPTQDFLSEVFTQADLVGSFPGFLRPDSAPVDGESSQDFTPSMVTWGLWRFFGIDGNTIIGAGLLPVKLLSSGYIGEGEVAVAPHLFWTRILVPYQDTDVVYCPSANLVLRGAALDLSVPQEITQMMRAVNR